VHSTNAGGVQKRAVAIANGLASCGHGVEFVAVQREGSVGSALSPRVTLVHLLSERPPWYRPRLLDGLRELRSHVAESRPDVLLAASTNVHLIAILAAKRLSPRPAIVLRASRHPVRQIPSSRPVKRSWDFWRRRLDRWLYNQADLVVAVSEDVGNALRGLLADPDRCVSLPNPVVSEDFLQSLQHPPQHRWLDGKVPVVLAVGRLVWQKGFDCLLSAFARVVEQHQARLIILGEGNLRRKLECQVEALGIGEFVDLPGHVDEVGPCMARASVVVSSSNFEGSPGVLIEALAAGCPVVATDCPGGSAELLRDLDAGLLVPVGDPDALTRGVETAMTRRWERQKLRTIATPYLERRATARYAEVLATLARRSGRGKVRQAAASINERVAAARPQPG
jgi:glycosyltransferase involved in cell wall biosynthesis